MSGVRPHVYTTTICHSFINNKHAGCCTNADDDTTREGGVNLPLGLCKLHHPNFSPFLQPIEPNTHTQASFYVVPHLNQFRFGLEPRYPLASFIQRSVARKRFSLPATIKCNVFLSYYQPTGTTAIRCWRMQLPLHWLCSNGTLFLWEQSIQQIMKKNRFCLPLFSWS
jgi:hypothetical protein